MSADEKKSRKRNYTPKSPEEKKQEINQLIEAGTQAIKAYQDSPEAMLDMADFMSQIHRYSFRNLSLIQNQFRGALAVASFADWKSKGFSVNKGEKGIKILVPTPVKSFQDEQGDWKTVSQATLKEKAEIENGQIKVITKTFFKQGTVFDVSQTNATEADLPEIFPNRVFNFDLSKENSLAELQTAVDSLATSVGIDVKNMRETGQELGVARGAYIQYVNGKDLIVLNDRNSETQNIAVTIHELAHKKLHNKDILSQLTDEDKKLGISSAQVKEFQAELTSYVVCKNYGMDTKNHAIPYIAQWTNQTKNIDLKIMLPVLEGVRSTAHEFISVMDTSILNSREHIKSPHLKERRRKKTLVKSSELER